MKRGEEACAGFMDMDAGLRRHTPNMQHRHLVCPLSCSDHMLGKAKSEAW